MWVRTLSAGFVNGLGIGGGYLHPVVLGRIVGGRNLDGSVESVIGRAEIHHRRRTEADVIYIGSGIVDAPDDGFVNLFGGSAAVAAHQHLIGFQQLTRRLLEQIIRPTRTAARLPSFCA